MAMSRGIAPELLEPWVTTIFFRNFQARALQYEAIFDVVSSSRAFEDDFSFAGLGPYTIKPEGVPLAYDSAVQGDRRRTIMLTFALGFRVTMEMMEDDQHGIIAKLPADLSEAAYYSMETLAFGLINDAFLGAAYTGLPEGDGTRRALCSTGHVYLKSPGVTWSNSLAPVVALSVSGIEAALTMFRLQKSEEERFITLNPQVILAHPNQEWTLRKLIDSDREAFTADNTKNIIGQEGLKPMFSPHLSSTTAWFVVASKDQHTLKFWKRKDLAMAESTDSDTFDKKYQSHWRGNVSFAQPRGFVGSNA